MKIFSLIGLVLLSAAALLGFQSCRPAGPVAWTPYFVPVVLADTLFVSVEAAEDPSGTAMPTAVFLATLDTTLTDLMIYPPDTTDMQMYGQWTIPVDETYQGYLVEVRQNWFIFRYLCLFSKRTQQFADLIPLAQFYGGEGGQVLTQGLLFDWENQRVPKILTRQSEHALLIVDDDLKDTYTESVSLRQWNGNRFQEVAVPDSSRWIRAYPINW